jgi:peptide/nickel transport system permease protein
MTEASLTAVPIAETQPKPPIPKPPTNSIFRHAVYVVADNPVTGLSFGLFVLIAVCALIGPYIVPYDPLASDTSATLQSPSLHHWFGTDLLGRDIFSRVLAATRLDFMIAVASVALVLFMGGLAGIAAGFFGGWTDRIVGRISDTIMAFPLFVLAMGIVAALGNTVTISCLQPRSSIFRFMSASPGRKPTCGAMQVLCRRRASPATASFASCSCTFCRTSCRL